MRDKAGAKIRGWKRMMPQLSIAFSTTDYMFTRHGIAVLRTVPPCRNEFRIHSSIQRSIRRFSLRTSPRLQNRRADEAAKSVAHGQKRRQALHPTRWRDVREARCPSRASVWSADGLPGLPPLFSLTGVDHFASLESLCEHCYALKLMDRAVVTSDPRFWTEPPVFTGTSCPLRP